jgi:hypothetical protein
MFPYAILRSHQAHQAKTATSGRITQPAIWITFQVFKVGTCIATRIMGANRIAALRTPKVGAVNPTTPRGGNKLIYEKP